MDDPPPKLDVIQAGGLLMKVSAIASATSSGVIGSKGAHKLLWTIPEDLAFFRAQTLGKTLIMGRSTYESIGCRLSGRETIVITNQKNYKCPYENSPLYFTSDKYEALGYAEEIGKDVYVAGGEQIYNMFLPAIDEWYITRVYGASRHKIVNPVYLPQEIMIEGSQTDDWELSSKSVPHLSQSGDGLSYSFEVWRRSLTSYHPYATVYS